MGTGAQLARRRRISEAAAAAAAAATAAASQDSNGKQAEVEVSERDEDEGDPTDVEADFEETTAMAMRDRVVQCQRLFAWTWGLAPKTLTQARSRRRKDLTADIRTVFTKDERMLEDGTVKVEH